MSVSGEMESPEIEINNEQGPTENYEAQALESHEKLEDWAFTGTADAGSQSPPDGASWDGG